MHTRDKFHIVLLIVGALLIALIVNLLFLANWQLIPTSFSNSEWLSFWASYITGVFAIIACYYTIQSANKNSREAIMQQNAILIRQKSDDIYKEIAEEIKLQVSLFNLVSFTSTILISNEDDLPRMKEEVLKKKSDSRIISLIAQYEQLLEGKKIRLGDLGDFSVSLASKGADTADKFSAQNITGVNVVWDCGQEFKNLINDAEFNLVASRSAQAAVLKAIKAGESVVDLSKPEGEGSTDDPNGGGNTPSGGQTPSGGGTNTQGGNQQTGGNQTQGGGSTDTGGGQQSGGGTPSGDDDDAPVFG